MFKKAMVNTMWLSITIFQSIKKDRRSDLFYIMFSFLFQYIVALYNILRQINRHISYNFKSVNGIRYLLSSFEDVIDFQSRTCEFLCSDILHSTINQLEVRISRASDRLDR